MYAIIQHNSNFPDRDTTIKLNASVHNIGFSSVKFCNCLFFKLFRFPRKELLQHIQEREYGEIVQVKSFIRVCIKKQYTAVCLVVRYSIRTAGESKNQHVITEKEMVFKVQAEKKELIALVRPYLSRLYESNKKEDADLIRSYFEEYVNPTSLHQSYPEINQRRGEIPRHLFFFWGLINLFLTPPPCQRPPGQRGSSSGACTPPPQRFRSWPQFPCSNSRPGFPQ